MMSRFFQLLNHECGMVRRIAKQKDECERFFIPLVRTVPTELTFFFFFLHLRNYAVLHVAPAKSTRISIGRSDRLAC